MRTLLRSILLAVVGCGLCSQSLATTCAYDPVPAASLVFPFVVFDYNEPLMGDMTILTITNTSPDAQIVHVTIWSDLHVPVLGFDIVLSGYDMQRINIRDILADGQLPVTGTSGSLEVAGGATELGPVDGTPDLPAPESSATLAARCPTGYVGYPGNYATPVPQSVLELMKMWLQLSQTSSRVHSDCAGSTYPVAPPPTVDARDESDPTWMYVTADVVWTCNRQLPDTDGATYWSDGPANNPGLDPAGAQRMTDNVLMGDIVWVNAIERFSESTLAIHVEADAGLGDVSYSSPVTNPTSGRVQTLYHAWSSPFGVNDAREPLPTAWGLTYQVFESAGIDTTIRVWKAPVVPPARDGELTVQRNGKTTESPWVNPVITSAGDTLTSLDCLAYTYYSWDEDENVITGSGWEPNLMPLAVQEIPVSELALPGESGWVQIAWPPTNTPLADNYQTWVGVKTTAYGSYSVLRQAVVLAHGTCVQPLFGSGFELGSPEGWSGRAP